MDPPFPGASLLLSPSRCSSSSSSFHSSSSSFHSSSCFSPSNEMTRILEVTVESAKQLKQVGRKTKMYAEVHIKPDMKLRTRVAEAKEEGPTWKDRFVFAVDDDFLFDDKSSVSIDIYRPRRVLKDALVGKASCNLGGILQGQKDTGKDDGLCFIPVTKGSNQPNGVVKVGMKVWRSTAFSVMGECKEVNWAMEYGELMGEREIGYVKKRISLGCVSL